MKVQLLFFGRLTDVIENQVLDLASGVSDTDRLTEYLAQHFPGFAQVFAQSGSRIAVNKNFAPGNTPLFDGDEIAFMSALSGG